jgi:hypothetical protein
MPEKLDVAGWHGNSYPPDVEAANDGPLKKQGDQLI